MRMWDLLISFVDLHLPFTSCWQVSLSCDISQTHVADINRQLLLLHPVIMYIDGRGDDTGSSISDGKTVSLGRYCKLL
jgi:hypothetical protein